MIIRLRFPDSSLFPNRKSGKHWGSTQAAKVAARDSAFYLTKQAMAASAAKFPDGSIPLSLLFLTPDKHKRDMDNMLSAVKPQIDGIAMALGLDDSRFKPILIDWVLGPKEGGLIAAVGVQILSGMNLESMEVME